MIICSCIVVENFLFISVNLQLAHPCKRPTAPLEMAEQSDEQTLTENTVSGTVNRRPPTKVRIQITISSCVSLAFVCKSQLSIQVGIS